ncbi:MAG: Crp/Fnr family transcriptional regulator [Kosmotoga sp.]|nr:MAG: Crp/Fnr family transcriptional regulator [Kosmotoga sp.]
MNDIVSILKKLELFGDFSHKDLEKLVGRLSFSIAHYKKGEIIKLMGDDYNELLILMAGKISSEMQDLNGKAMKVETMAAPEIIASGVLFSNQYKLPVDIISVEDCSMLVIPKISVIKLCQENQKFLSCFLQDMGNRICFLANRMYSLTMKTLKEKIALFILEKSDGRNSFELNMTKEEISRLFGVARPSLSRTFQEIIHNGLIVQEGNKIIIKDRSNLVRLAGTKNNNRFQGD